MNSIRSKLILYILLASLVPVFAFLLYALVFVNDRVTDSQVDAYETKVVWANQYLEQVIEQLDDIVYSLHIQDDLLTLVDESQIQYGDIEDTIRSTLYNNGNLLSKVSIVSTNSYRGVSYDYENGFASRLYQYDELNLLPGQEQEALRFYDDGGSTYVIHTINDFETRTLEGVIVLRLNDIIADELERIFGTTGTHALFTPEDDLITTGERMTVDVSDPILYNQLQLTETRNNYIWTKRVKQLDLYVSLVVPERDVEAFGRTMISVGVAIIASSIALTAVVSVLLAEDITAPITRLAAHMNKDELDPLDKSSDKYQEITVLETSYNDMVDKINKLITEQYQNEIERQNIQLKALQAQINPHFLANTFQLIGGMAMDQDAPDVYDATIKMSKLVRYAMRIDEKAVTLEEELLHIRDYLDIQKLRYGDRLAFNVAIDPHIKAVRIPKFTIQPIIENSFKYGLKKQHGDWRIAITSDVNEDIVIQIADNGVGMEPATMADINDMLHQRTPTGKRPTSEMALKIGLVNINSRIKLLYGNAYGLTLLTNPDGGVTVAIKLPNEVVSS